MGPEAVGAGPGAVVSQRSAVLCSAVVDSPGWHWEHGKLPLDQFFHLQKIGIIFYLLILRCICCI